MLTYTAGREGHPGIVLSLTSGVCRGRRRDLGDAAQDYFFPGAFFAGGLAAGFFSPSSTFRSSEL
jgi:hypothetical protein